MTSGEARALLVEACKRGLTSGPKRSRTCRADNMSYDLHLGSDWKFECSNAVMYIDRTMRPLSSGHAGGHPLGQVGRT